MKLRRRLLALALSTLLWSPSALADIRLPDTVAPVRQSVFLEVDPALDHYRGSTEISLFLKKESQEIVLHALDLTVTKAVLSTKDGKERELQVTPMEDGKLKLVSRTPIPSGEANLSLAFEAPFNRRSVGLYKYLDGGTPYLSTQFEMTDARRCFPCFDEPGFKIPYQMTVKAPKGAKVYNNTAETEVKVEGDWKTHTFAETQPLPSYLVALAVGPYEETPVPELSVPGRVVTTTGKLGQSKAAIDATPRILEHLQDYFAIDYAYGKLDQVAVTEFPFGAMENAGMVTYREDILLLNEATAQRRNRERMLNVIAHELAHQWFGNLVTMEWWDDLWLNEAFATWMANKVVHDLYPDFESNLVAYQNAAMGEDGKATARAIRKPIRTDSDIMDGLGLNYTKGAAVLTMLERWIGADTFRQGIRSYMASHKFANAQAADLWQALSLASDKDVASVLKSYTEQPGYPVLEVNVRGKVLSLTQSRYSYAGNKVPAQTWTFPVAIRYGSGKREAIASVLMTQEQAEVTLPFSPEWLYPDDGGVGYYRWSLSEKELKALLSRRDRLSEREEIVLLANLGSLYDAGRIDAGKSLAYSAQFLSDPHPSVVSPALSNLSGLRFVMVDDSNREDWQRYLSRATKPLLDRLGWTTRPGEPAKDSELRQQLLALLSRDLENTELLKTASTQTEAFLQGGAEVDQALLGVYLMLTARRGDTALLENVINALAEADDPQRRTTLLTMLGQFGEPEAHQAALDAMLSAVVTPSDLRTLLSLNGVEEERRQRLQRWVENNYEAITGKLPSAFLALVVSSQSGITDLDTLAEVQAFYSAKPDPQGALKRELDKLSETVKLTVSERQRGLASFHRALR